MRKAAVPLIAVLLLQGCANQTQTGAGAGAVVGGLAGALLGGNGAGRLIGGLIGAGVGTGVGALVGSHYDQKAQADVVGAAEQAVRSGRDTTITARGTDGNDHFVRFRPFRQPPRAYAGAAACAPVVVEVYATTGVIEHRSVERLCRDSTGRVAFS